MKLSILSTLNKRGPSMVMNNDDYPESDNISAILDNESESPEPKSKEAILKESSLTGVFSMPEQEDPLKMLFTPGVNVNNLLMRGNHKDRALMIAACHIIAQCREFNDKVGLDECLMVLAGACGVQQGRAELLVSAYVGQQERKKKQGLGEWIRSKAGLNNGAENNV